MKESDLLKRLDSITTNAELLECLNLQPPEAWIQVHPEITEYRYLPISRVEQLLKAIFKLNFRIELVDHKEIFNTVSVVIRIHYKEFDSPGNWLAFDGASAEEPEKSTTSDDFGKFTPYAIAKAFPAAKSNAVRNACLSFGNLFGNSLNRNSYPTNQNEKQIKTSNTKMLKELIELFEKVKTKCGWEDYLHYQRIIDDKETENYAKSIRELKTIK